MPINMFRGQSNFKMQHWLQHSTLALAIGTAMVASINVATMPTAEAAVTTADFSGLVQQVTPAVARVNVTKTVSEAELAKAQTAELLRQFFGDRLRIPEQAATPAIEHAYGTAFLSPKMAICSPIIMWSKALTPLLSPSMTAQSWMRPW